MNKIISKQDEFWILYYMWPELIYTYNTWQSFISTEEVRQKLLKEGIEVFIGENTIKIEIII